MKNILLILVVILNTFSVFPQSNKEFLDCSKIIYKVERNIEIDSISTLWGKSLLHDLKIENLSNIEKAKKINGFLYKEFKYNSSRQTKISEIIDKKKGNCVTHAIMGIFLLRLADVPAKFAHEVHIIKENTIVSLIIGRYAKKNNDGINSYWHNDHVWVWFDTGDNWEPFDAALGIVGFEEFYQKRYFKHKELSNSFIEKWTGPPFCIWEDNCLGLSEMKNVTSQVWNNSLIDNESRIKTEWLELVMLFNEWNKKDFYKEYLDDQKIDKIKSFSKIWFRTR